MRLSPLSQVRSAITGKNRFPVTIRQIHVDQLPNPTLASVFDDLPASIGNQGYRANASGFGLTESGAQIDSLDRLGGGIMASASSSRCRRSHQQCVNCGASPIIVQPLLHCNCSASSQSRSQRCRRSRSPPTVLTFSLCWQSAALNAHTNLYAY
jgi:hypothetical protein